MTDILVLIITVLAVVIVALLFVVIKSVKSGGDSQKVAELEKQVSALSMYLQRVMGSNAEEFERNRRELNESLHFMTSKLDEMTKQNYETLIKLNKDMTDSLNLIRTSSAELNEKQTRTLDAAIGRMQESNEKKLDQMRETVDEKLTATLSTRLDSSFKTVSEQLENVYKSLGEMKELSTGVTTNVTALNRVLTNVKARGTWAEIQLEGILDQTIPNMYVKNYAAVPGSRDLVEFAVKIPSSDDSSKITYLPIDSKFPMEDYKRVCEAADNADAVALAAARKALYDRVLTEAKTIKKYINVPSTTPFAIMYLATEGLYAEITSSSSDILDKIQRENIMVAGPTTIIALLNTLSMGFKAVAINEKANEVRQLLAVTKAQYEKFGTVLEKARKKIDEAGKSLDEAQDRNRIIQKKLKNIEEIDTAAAEDYLGIGENFTQA
ncbi:MAG: DNA recombination protein RmuC [Acutalibacteraceae bacterium]|nr:DNA recombination protein RmuC [Acutalibacteraceae bacterium]